MSFSYADVLRAEAAMVAVQPGVAAVAAKYGIPADDLDWHLEAVHGWEPHDAGYPDAIEAVARCHLIWGAGCHPL